MTRSMPAALLLCVSACGTVRPDAVTKPSPRYSHADYVVGIGTSSQGPAAAEADARARVAAQIASVLEATLTAESRSDNGQSSERAHQKITTTTRFEHSEWIRVAPGDVRCEDGECTALAVLERRAAVEVLEREYGGEAVPFRTATAAALKDPSDLPAFTRHFREAERGFARLVPLGRELAAIGGEPCRVFTEDQRRRDDLAAARETVLSSIHVVVLPSEVSAGDLDPLVQSALVGALQTLGLQAAAASVCQSGFDFLPRTTLACAPSGLGPRCELGLSGVLRACGSGAPVAKVDFRSAPLASVHPRSTEDARRKLGDRVTPAALVGAMRAGLEQVVPIR